MGASWREKSVAAGLALVVTVSGLLAGCSSAAKTSGSGSAEGSHSAAKETVTIEYWHVNNQDWGGNAIKELVKKFNETHDGIQVVERYQPGNYAGLLQNAQAAISAGTPPDVAQIGYNFITYVHENVPYTPIEQIASKDEKDPGFIEKNFQPHILKLGQTADGRLAGLPYALSNPVLYYNADLLRKAGWDPDKPPKTWEEVRTLSRQIKEKTGKFGLYIQEPPDNWAQYALVRSNGGDWMKEENGEKKVTVDSPEVIEVYDMMGQMAKEGLALHTSWEEGMQAFINGQVGMMMTTIGRREHIESQSSFDLRATVIPTFGDKPRAVTAGGNALFVFAQDPVKQQAAWEFIKFLESPEALTVWVKATGYLPPVNGVAEDPNALKPFFDSNPLMQAAVAQMDDIVPWFNFPGANGLQAEQALLDARDQVLSGSKTAEEALKEAAEKIRKLVN